MSPTSGPTVGGDFVRVFGEGLQDGLTVDGQRGQRASDPRNGTSATNAVIEFRTLAHAEGDRRRRGDESGRRS